MATKLALNQIYARILCAAGPIRLDESKLRQYAEEFLHKLTKIPTSVAPNYHEKPLVNMVFKHPITGDEVVCKLAPLFTQYGLLSGGGEFDEHTGDVIKIETGADFYKLDSEKIYREELGTLVALLQHEVTHLFQYLYNKSRIDGYVYPDGSHDGDQKYYNQVLEVEAYGQQLYGLAKQIGSACKGQSLNNLQHIAWRLFKQPYFVDRNDKIQRTICDVINKNTYGNYLSSVWDTYWKFNKVNSKKMMDYFLKGIRDGYSSGV